MFIFYSSLHLQLWSIHRMEYTILNLYDETKMQFLIMNNKSCWGWFLQKQTSFCSGHAAYNLKAFVDTLIKFKVVFWIVHLEYRMFSGRFPEKCLIFLITVQQLCAMSWSLGLAVINFSRIWDVSLSTARRSRPPLRYGRPVCVSTTNIADTAFSCLEHQGIRYACVQWTIAPLTTG